MAFEGLSDKLQGVIKKLRGKGKISEAELKEVMREVRIALLEADVNFKVVREFVKNVNEKALGEEVMESLTPGQQIIKIVNEELAQLMGGTVSKLDLSGRPPLVIMMVGLQGAGKTTSTGKLANHLRKQGRRPLMVACDVYRPAAVKQLEVLGKQLDLPVFSLGTDLSPVEIAKKAMEHAKEHGNDIVLIDTAGRLHIDEELMNELKDIKEVTEPKEILLVVDSMTGQDAVNVAESFNDLLDISGVVLTKLDGDTRGGAALSVKAVTGKPVKFVGMGEKLDALEPFHPDRMSSRILGMGDVLTLIEKAQDAFDQEKAKEMEKKMMKAQFTLEDFLDQMEQMKNMGPIDQMMEMIPGMSKAKVADMQVNEKELAKTEALIRSMTPAERQNPAIINGSRRKRIAAGSGARVQDVNRLIKQFSDAQKMMRQLSGQMSRAKKGGKSKMKFPLF